MVGSDAAGGGSQGAEEFAVEEDRAAERKLWALDDDGLVVFALVLGGKSRSYGWKPTTRAAMGPDCLP